MASKRNSTDSPANNAGAAVKRSKMNFDSEFRFVPSSEDELDIGVRLLKIFTLF